MSNQIETQIEVQLADRNRLTAFFRIFLAIPALIFVSSFSGWQSDESSDASNHSVEMHSNNGLYFTDVQMPQDGWESGATWAVGFLVLPVVLALLFRNKYPSYVLNFNKAFLNLSLRVTAYVLLLTDKYPTIEESEVVQTTFPEIEGGAKLNRFLPLVKWLLAIPLYIVGIFYAVYGLIYVFISWINILLTGSMSTDAADIICKVLSYWNRVTGYTFILVTDEYPSFRL